jgi:hypothetical protein
METEIIQKFIDSGYQHMNNIPNNRIFVTDSSTSTLAWVEDNVVIEYYMLHPNKVIPMHSHPFRNQLIFLGGDMVVRRQNNIDSEDFTASPLTDRNIGKLSSVCPANYKHGFRVGPRGAWIYNIQIWENEVKDPLSAALVYTGTPMGPEHEKLISSTQITQSLD